MVKHLVNTLTIRNQRYFSTSTHPGAINIATLLGVSQTIGTLKYLELPSIIGRRKKAIFGFLKGKLWTKINHWSTKFLRKAGKEVLIITMAQSIPTYCMSVFLLPITLQGELEKNDELFLVGKQQTDRERNPFDELGKADHEERIQRYGFQTSLCY